MLKFNSFFQITKATILILLFILCCFPLIIFSQDLVLQKIENQLSHLNSKSLTNSEYTLDLFKQTLKFAQSEKHLKGEWKVLKSLGNYHRKLSQFDDAIKYHQQASQLAEKLDSAKYLGFSWYELGEDYMRAGRLEKSKELTNKANSIFIKTKNLEWQGRILNLMGNLNTQLGKNDISIQIINEH